MESGRQFQHWSGPAGPAAEEGLPWVRLVTGVFIVAVSLMVSWRAGRLPDPFVAPVAAPTALAAPIVPLQPAQAEDCPPLALQEPPPPAAAPLKVAATPIKPVQASRRAHHVRRSTARARAPASVARRGPSAVAAVQPARTKLGRTRAEVRQEYIAAREQVAALTGEDSGSAFLARLAARRVAVPTRHAGARSLATRASQVPARRTEPTRA